MKSVTNGVVENVRAKKINPLIRSIHIYSSLFVLLLMMFFSVTGFLLNHPELDASNKKHPELSLKAPSWASEVDDWTVKTSYYGLLLMQWLDNDYGIKGNDYSIEWDDIDELLLVNIQGPGKNIFVELLPSESLVSVRVSQFSFLGMLNNIHRTKHTSGVWSYISDVSAILMLVFCLSGVWLLLINQTYRFKGLSWLAGGSGLFVLVVYLMY